MASANGNCFICGKTAGKTAIKNHLLKDHNDGEEACLLPSFNANKYHSQVKRTKIPSKRQIF